MAAKNDTTMTIRTNKEIKQEAQEIFSALGIDITTAINVFLRQAIASRGFPFDVRLGGQNTGTFAAHEPETSTEIVLTDDEKIDVAAARIMERYRPALEELAK